MKRVGGFKGLWKSGENLREMIRRKLQEYQGIITIIQENCRIGMKVKYFVTFLEHFLTASRQFIRPSIDEITLRTSRPREQTRRDQNINHLLHNWVRGRLRYSAADEHPANK